MRLAIGRPIRWTEVPAGVALGCALVLFGCGASGVSRPPLQGAERIVMAPVNLAVRLPQMLEDAVEPVNREMIRYLQERDARVAVIWPSDASNLWRDAVATVAQSDPGERRFDEAVGEFVRALTEHADFQLFMLPSLVIRGARVRGRTAEWDGVRRRVTGRSTGVAGAGHHEPGTEFGDTHWSGEIPAVSLHVLVFTPGGRRVYEGWGGLVLTHAPALSNEWRAGAPSILLQPGAFDDPEQIHEGIAVALDAYAGSLSP